MMACGERMAMTMPNSVAPPRSVGYLFDRSTAAIRRPQSPLLPNPSDDWTLL